MLAIVEINYFFLHDLLRKYKTIRPRSLRVSGKETVLIRF